MSSNRRNSFFKRTGDIFAAGGAKTSFDGDNCDKFYQQIGRLQIENPFLEKSSYFKCWGSKKYAQNKTQKIEHKVAM